MTALNTPLRAGGGDIGIGKRAHRRWGHTVTGVLLLAVMLFPLYWMANVSLRSGASAVSTPWLPLHPSFDGYVTAIRSQGRNLLTSLVVSVGTVAFSLVVATPAAYALAHFRVRGAGVVLLGILISQMIPGIVVANALYRAYSDLGLLNSVPGLILADSSLGIPFAILIMRAYLASLPGEVIEAARVDGAGQVRAFVSIVLPMSRNALITAALFTFLFSWSDFLFALTLTTTPDVRPVTLGIYQYLGLYVSDWGAVMASAVLASLPAVVLLLVAQRFVAAGVSTGAVK
jgi:multiple sugar transport system permease protein